MQQVWRPRAATAAVAGSFGVAMLIGAASLGVAGCSALAVTGPPKNADGHDWKLARVHEPDHEIIDVQKTGADAQFAGDKVTGSTGAARYQATLDKVSGGFKLTHVQASTHSAAGTLPSDKQAAVDGMNQFLSGKQVHAVVSDQTMTATVNGWALTFSR